MGPDLDFDLTPLQQQVGVVSLFLGHLTKSVHIVECLEKIREVEISLQVVSLDDLPVRMKLSQKLLASLLGQGGDSPLARNACLLGEATHSAFSGVSLRVACMCQ